MKLLPNSNFLQYELFPYLRGLFANVVGDGRGVRPRHHEVEEGVDGVEGVADEEDCAACLEGGCSAAFGIVCFYELDFVSGYSHFSNEVWREIG